MEGWLLNEHMGEIVRIETDQQRHKYRPYVGKIAGYDKDFIRLNPYAIKLESVALNPSIEEMQKCEAGSTGLDILLGRGVIASLEKI